MGLYNRARIIVLDPTLVIRDRVSACTAYDAMLNPLGATYAGSISHAHNAPRPAHFYLMDDPTDDALASLLLLVKNGVPLRIIREIKGGDSYELNFNSIVANVARILAREMIDGNAASNDLALCWSGVKVLATVAAAPNPCKS